MWYWTCVASILNVVLFPLIAAAQASATQPKPDVVFKHPEGKAQIFNLDLNHGQRFVVQIEDTCLAAFDYSYVGIERGVQEQAERTARKELEPKNLAIVYDQQYGGYVFHITAKPGVAPGDLCAGGEKLTPLSFIVSINQRSWNLSFSGGFSVSGLTNPEFSVVTTNGVKKVIRETDKENTRKLGVASFVHLFHDNVQWKQLHPALAFGLGINNDNRTEYMVGGALRFGDRATVNVGRVWGSIDRLPNGTTFDTPITDDNVLSNKGTQVVSRWFFALSYSFIDTKDRLTKPFAPDTGQASTSTPMAATPAAPSAADQKASAAAVQAAAKAAATYKNIPELVGPVAKGICDATTSGTAAKTVVTVKVKGASATDLTTMQAKTTSALTAISTAAEETLKADAKKLVLTLSDVKFETCE